MEEPKQKIIASTLEKAKYLLPRKKTHKILLGIIALVVAGSVTYFALATPIPVWVATTSNNCPAQDDGSNFTLATVGGKEYLYYIPGGSTSFLRYDPEGISGGTGDCESTALTSMPYTAYDGTDMEAIDYDDDGEDDFIYAFIAGANSSFTNWFFVYDIANDDWVQKARGLYDETTHELIPERPDLAAIDHEELMAAYNNKIYSSSEYSNAHFEIYDTATNTWSSSSSAPSYFDYYSTATTSLDPSSSKDIYMVNDYNSFSKYDADADTWSTLTMPSSNFSTGAAIANNGQVGNPATLIYAFTGGGKSNNFLEYNISGNSWSSLADTPNPVFWGAALIYPGYGDYVYAIAGNYSDDFWRYSISGDSWDESSLAQLPFKTEPSQRGLSVTTDGTDIYLVKGNYTKDFWKYDISEDSWIQLESTPYWVGGDQTTYSETNDGGIVYIPSGPSGGGEIYLTTGWADDDTNSGSSLFRYVISDGRWHTFNIPKRMPTDQNFYYGSALAYPGENTSGDKDLYVLRGIGSPDFYKYSLDLTEWIPWNRSIFDEIDNIPVAEHPDRYGGHTFVQNVGTTMTEVNDDLYVMQADNEMDKYDPGSNSWTSLFDVYENAPSIGNGTAMVGMDDENILVTQGDGSMYVHKYNIPQGRWISSYNDDRVCMLDNGSPIARSPYTLGYESGADITEHNGDFYIGEGNNQNFLKYSTTENEWTKLISSYEQGLSGFGDGLSFSAVDDKIYVAGGNYNFYIYDIPTNTWSTLTNIPSGTPATPVAGGGDTVYPGTGDTIYLIKGNNSKQFFKYDITNHSTGAGTWTQLADLPGDTGPGASLTIIGNSIYALRGKETTSFYHYNISGDTWTELTHLPHNHLVATGGAIAADTTNEVLYVQVGNQTDVFLKYEITNNTTGEGNWSIADPLPEYVGYNYRLGNTYYRDKDGGGLVYFDNGGNPDIWSLPISTASYVDIWRYNIADGRWVLANPLDAPAGISSGGALAHPDGSDLVYALGGNNTTNFWPYNWLENTWYSKELGALPGNIPISQDNTDMGDTGDGYDEGNGNRIIEINGDFYVTFTGGEFRKYDPESNLWIELDDPYLGPIDGGAAYVKYDDDNIFAHTYQNKFYRYDVKHDQWIEDPQGKLTPDSTSSFSPYGGLQGSGNAIAEYDGEIYIIPGAIAGQANTDIRFEKYNTSTDTWTQLDSLPESFTALGSELLLVDDGSFPALYYFVLSGTAATANMYRFDLTSQQWDTTGLANGSEYFSTGSATAYSSYDGASNTTHTLYTLQGNGTGFYKYEFTDTATGDGTWTTNYTEEPAVPLDTPPNSISYGGNLVALCDTCEKLYAYAGGTISGPYEEGFYEYDISTNTWTDLGTTDPIPMNNNTSSTYGTIAITLYKAMMVSDGTYIYFAPGNSSSHIFRYDPSGTAGQRWSPVARPPVYMGYTSNYYEQGDLAYCPNAANHCDSDSTGIYMTPGHEGSDEPWQRFQIYKYDIATDTWPLIEPVLNTNYSSSLYFNRGAAMAYPGTGDTLYATRGNASTNFWTFDIPDNTWQTGPLPVGDSSGNPISGDIFQKNQGYGASMTRIDNILYVLPGQADYDIYPYQEDDEFFSYNITTNEWKQLPSIEWATSENYGMAIEAVGTDIWMNEGYSTNDINKYNTLTGQWTQISPNALSTYASNGADLAYPGTGNYIYASRGNGSNEIRKCDITDLPSCNSTWGSVTFSGGTPPSFNGGGDMVGVNLGTYGEIYALSGNNSNTFWKLTMDASGNGAYTALATLPWSVQTGGSLTTDDSQTYIWATRGYGTGDIARYDIAGNSWTLVDALTDCPCSMGQTSTSYDRGDIVWVPSTITGGTVSGGDEIYAMTGNGDLIADASTDENTLLYRYVISSDTWPMVSLVSQPPVSFGDGGSMIGLGGYIYALPGNGSTEFLQYDVSGDSWDSTTYDNFPSAVRNGGSLTTDGVNTIYGSRGYNTTEIYGYDISDIPTNTWDALGATIPVGIGTTTTTAAQGGIAYTDSGPSGGPELFASPGDGKAISEAGKGLLYRYIIGSPSWPTTVTTLDPVLSTIAAGGSLLAVGSTDLYALKGGNSTAFYNYSITDTATGEGSWSTLNSTPLAVNGGASLATDGAGTIFASRGNAFPNFYEYNIGTGLWTSLTGTFPVRMGGQNSTSGAISDGGEIAYAEGELWATTGRGDSDWDDEAVNEDTGLLYRYNGTGWPYLREANPLPDTSNNTFAEGSDLVPSADGDVIYALRGTSAAAASASNSNFWEYDVSSDGLDKGTWTQLTNIPNDTTPTSIGSGGSLAAIGDAVFALAGGSVEGFYKYSITGDTWEEQDSLPVPVGGASGSDQGGIEYVPSAGSVFATPGNGGDTIYKFPVVRLTIDTVEETVYDDGNIQSGESMDLTVVAVDETDTPYNVPANVDVEIEVKTGNGSLYGTLTGTISSGSNSTVISGVYYDTPESGIVLSAVDVTTGSPTLRFGTSDSDPFTVYIGALSISNVDITDGPSAGNTPVTIQGSNLIAHYYKPITVHNNSATAISDEAVQVTFDTSQAITDGKMNSDCSNIRFTDSIPSGEYGSDASLLDYNLESGCNSSETIAAVKMDLPSSGDNTIYVNYGDPGLSDASTNVYTTLLEDDFTGTTLDTGKWKDFGSFNTYLKQDDAIIGTAGTYTQQGFHSTTLFNRSDNPILTFDFTPTGYYYYFVMGWKSTADLLGTYSSNVTNGGFYHGMNCNQSYESNDVYEDGTSYNSIGSLSWTQDQAYKIRITLKSTGGALYERSTDGGDTWETYYESSSETDAQARVGFIKYYFPMIVDNVQVTTAPFSDVTITEDPEVPTLEIEYGSGNYATIVNASASEVNILTPLDSTGTYPNTVDLIITNSFDDSVTRTNDYTYHAPSISSIIPDSGPGAGGTNVDITGLYFTPSQYIQPIDITVGEALTDYQENVTLDSNTLALLGKTRRDMTDLRFYEDEDLTSEIDTFWIADPTIFTADTDIWVKIPSLSVGTNTIYAVYGDLSLTSLPVNAILSNVFDSVADVIAFWPMDEASGTVTIAEEVSGNDATMYGDDPSTYVATGKYGNAREWDQAASTNVIYATAPVDSDTFNFGSDGISFEAWVYVPNSSYDSTIVSKLTNPCTSSPGPGWRFRLYNGRPRVDLYYAASSYYYTYDSGDYVTFNDWTHVVGTVDPSTNYVRLYMDGIETDAESESISTPSNFANANGFIYIGGEGECSSSYSKEFNGLLDEVRIYNRVLNSTEVADLYAEGRGIFLPGQNEIFLQQAPATTPTVAYGTEYGDIDLQVDSTPATVNDATSISVNFDTPPHADGSVEVRVTNLDAEYATTSYQYGDVSTDPDTSTVVAVPTSDVEADGTETSLVTVTLNNGSSVPVPGMNVSLTQIDQPVSGTTIITAVTCASGGTAGVSNTSGEACFEVSTAPASTEGVLGTYEFEAEDTSSSVTITQTATVGFIKPIFDEPSSSFTAPAGDVTADGVATKTTTTAINNSNSVGISGHSVTVAQESGPGTATIGGNPGTTDSAGEATHTISTTTAGTYTFRVTDTTEEPDVQLTDIVSVDFIAGPFSNPDSTTSASKGTVIANSLDSTIITATLYDAYSNPISGKTVSLAETSGPGGSNIVTVQGTTDTAGEAIFTVDANISGAYVFTATNVTDGNTDLTDTESITFTGPTAGDSTVVTDTVNVLPTGLNKAKITVTLKDGSGILFPDRSITLNQDGSASIDAINCDTDVSLGSGATADTDSSGQVCYYVTNTTQEIVEFSAYNNDEGFSITETVIITFDDGIAWGYEEVVANAVSGPYYDISETQVVRIINTSLEHEYITAWIDNRNGGNYVYAQKFSYDDTTQTIAEEWATNGIFVRNAGTATIKNLRIINANGANAIVSWTETGTQVDFRSQVIGEFGTLGWSYTQSDIECSTGTNNCYEIVEDRDNASAFGFFLAYRDDTSNRQYITHIDEFGSTATGEVTTWPVQIGNSFDVCAVGTTVSLFLYSDLVPAAFYTYPGADCTQWGTTNWYGVYTTYNQSTPWSGSFYSGLAGGSVYERDGSTTSDCPSTQFHLSGFRAVSDHSGGAYLVFFEDCNSGDTTDNEVMYLAHLTSSHSGQWVQLMVPPSLTAGSGTSTYDIVAPSSIDGAIILWRHRYNGTFPAALYMDRIDDDSGTPDIVWGGASGDPITVDSKDAVTVPHLAVIGSNIYALWNWGTDLYGSLYNFSGSLQSGWTADGDLLTDKEAWLTDNRYAGSGAILYPMRKPAGIVGTALDDGVISTFNATIYHNYTDTDDDNFIQGFTPSGAPSNNTGDVPIADPDPPGDENQQSQAIAVTGEGEFVVAWNDRAYDEGNYKNYAEKFDVDGVRQWNPDEPGIGINLFPGGLAGDYFGPPTIAADISGGSKTGGIIEINGGYRSVVYAEVQKLNAAGTPQWTSDGLIVQDTSTYGSIDTNQGAMDITSDLSGGAFVMFTQQNSNSMNTIWGQQIYSAGSRNVSWHSTAAKEIVSSSGTTYEYSTPKVLYGGGSYLYLVTQRIDHGSGDKNDAMIYRLNKSNGTISSSSTVATTTNDNFLIDAQMDSTGSYIYVLYWDEDTSPTSFKIQKISASSGLTKMYGSSGATISSTMYDWGFVMALDATDTPIVAWERWWDDGEDHSDVVITRINPDTGDLLWDEVILTDPSNSVPKGNIQLASDGDKGAFVVWSVDNGSSSDIYAQQITASVPQDTQYGVAITSSGPLNYGPIIAGDNASGVYMTWLKAASPPDIYAQYYVQLDGFTVGNNSTFETDKPTVMYDGSDYAILTATVLDDLDAPIENDEIDVDIISGITSGVVIDAIVCADLPTITVIGSGGDISDTDTNGEACFRVTSTTEGSSTFAANDTTQSATIPDTPTIDFGLVYCEPPNVEGNSSDYGITNYTLDTDPPSTPVIDNDSSTAYIDYGTSPYPPLYLQDFTDTVTPGGLYKTLTYKGSVDHPTDVSTLGRIWIDYNRDGDFYDTGEEVASYANIFPFTLDKDFFSTFTVPETAVEGTTGMRVLSGTSLLDTVDPCNADFSLGYENAEFEDYLVTIEALTPSTDHSSFAPSPSVLPADDTTTSTLTVTVRNDADVPVPGIEITVQEWGGGAIAGDFTVVPDPTVPQTTDSNGQVTYTVRTGTPQTYTFQATMDGTDVIADGALVEFTYPDFGVSTFTADPLLVAADGTATSKLYATILDVGADPFQNTSVTITDSPISDTPTISYDEIDCTTEAVITADSNIGTTNSTGEVCFFVTSTTYGTSEFTATSKGTVLDDQPQVDFYGEPSDLHSTLVADPLSVPADDATASTLTATIKDGSTTGYPLEGEALTLTQTDGPGTANITAVDCPFPEPAGSSPGTTNENGKACFEVTSDTQGAVEFTAEVVSNATTVSTIVTFGCVVGPNEQCVQVNIGDTGVLTLEIPSNFDFPSTGIAYDPDNAQETFSYNDTTYPTDDNDVIKVTDTRDSGGFELQVQASAFEEPTTLEIIPLQNLFIATQASSTGELQLNGIEYGSGEAPAEEVSAELDTSGALDTAATFTSLLPGGMGTDSTGTVIVVMDGSLSTEPGRFDTFSQIVHYFLNIPAATLPGAYQVTLSFDLIAS